MTALWRRTQMERFARQDAALGIGIEAVEERIMALLGPRPELRLRDNTRHAQKAAALKKSALLSEVRDDLHTRRATAVRHVAPWLLVTGLVAAVIAEAVGLIWMLSGLGVGEVERLLLGIFTAAALTLLTSLLGDSARRAEGAEASRPGERRRFRLFLLLYGVLVVALAIARFEAQSEELGIGGQFSAAVLMGFACIGPSWAAERLLGKLRSAENDYGKFRELQRREKELAGEVRQGERFTTEMAQDSEQHDAEAVRLRAVYRAAYRLAAARRNQLPAPLDVPALPPRSE